MNIVLVIWEDAVSDDGWHDGENHDDMNVHEIKTVGYLVHEDPVQIVIASSVDEARGGTCLRFGIPRSCIRKIAMLPVLAEL